jgi:hypothetical protein
MDAYARLSLTRPIPSLVVVCHGFGCRLRTAIEFGAADWAKLTELLASGRASAEAERRAIAEATAWFDGRIGPAAGTTHRIPPAGALTENDSGQMDFIDTQQQHQLVPYARSVAPAAPPRRRGTSGAGLLA